ncbi:epoxide hydrolase [Acidiferrimicrobium sp. IK]|uniref:epoxide hydrolase family protein n=1 Tax=Acidiferrimicrobium sp. IK TaxID=2871700 RepID=UPI0021CB3271|nr:epoxide hydrolase family protein [Acidiferrimicrobium sp. IK]MCU4186997.1 epoxide hydrolase [Acidiferrimicrobium sp. IK]
MPDDDIVPFRIDVAQEDLDDLDRRLAAVRWPEEETVGDWSQGIPLAYLQDLVGYWAGRYDWRDREARLNRLAQYRTTIDGLGIHFLHVPSPVPDALPLVLTHGWPGSIVEFAELVGPLSDPAAHGGDPADAFHVVCPSLPGYGWSDRPTRPGWGIPRIADAWAALMARLGYDRFGAQGGDWGSGVTTALGARHPERLVGIHLNMVSVGPPDDPGELTLEEEAALAALAAYQRHESGYSTQQATRPQTLGYGLVDSPVGQCAWIVEKFAAWSDTGNDPVGALGADRVLDNVMLYWLPATGASSARLYWESFRRSRPGAVEVPTGAALFPKEIFSASRRWAERVYHDIRRWEYMPRGGHFAAMEQPELLLGEIREFFRPLR